MRSKGLRASAFVFGGYGLAQMLRLGGNIILARLLVPEAFGLMALVNVFVIGLQMFSDVGLGPSIIQNKRGDDERFLDTAWSIQIIRGVVLWGLAWIAAIPYAAFYEDPRLYELIPIVALSAVIGGFNSTKLFTAQRHLTIGRNTAIELFAQACALTTMVVFASINPTVWALVTGSLVSAGIKMLGGHIVLPGRLNRPAFDRDAARELIGFGAWVFLSSALTFVVMQGDRLIFGKLMTAAELGVYSIAALLASFPTQITLKLGSAVAFPLYSRAKDREEGLAPAFGKARFTLTFVGGLLALCLFVLGPGLIDALYDDRYADAQWMIRFVAVGVLFQVLEVTNGSALLALGRPRWVAAGNLWKLIGMAVLVSAGFMLWGVAGALGGIAASEALKYARSVHAIRESGLHVLRRDAVQIVLLVLTGAAAWGGGRWLGDADSGPGFHPLVIFGVQALFIGLVWSPGAIRAIKTLRSGRQ